MSSTQSGRSLFDSAPAVVTVVSIGHFLSHVYQLVLPPLFPLLAADLALSNSQLGLLVSILYVMMLLVQTPLGSLVDTIGAKQIFVAGLLTTSAGTVLAGLASYGEGIVPVYALLVVAAVIMGLGQSTFHPADYPLIEAVSDETNRGKYFGIHMFAGFLGFAVAPVVVGGLGLAYGWEIALISVGLVGIIYAGVTEVLLSPVYADQISERETTEESAGIFSEFSVLLRPNILAVLLFFTVVSIAGLGINSFTVVYVSEGFPFTEAVGNTVLSTYMILASIGILVGGILSDRLSVRALIVVMLLFTTGFIGVSIMADIVSSVLLLALFGSAGFCYGMTVPARDQLVSLVSPPDALGKSFGFVTSGIPIGGIVSPLLLGFVIDTADVFVAFWIVALAFFVSALIIAGMWIAER